MTFARNAEDDTLCFRQIETKRLPVCICKYPKKLVQGEMPKSQLTGPYAAAFCAISTLPEEVRAGIELKMSMSQTGTSQKTIVELKIPRKDIDTLVDSPVLSDIAGNCLDNQEIAFLSTLPCQGFLNTIALQLGSFEATHSPVTAVQALHGLQVCPKHRDMLMSFELLVLMYALVVKGTLLQGHT